MRTKNYNLLKRGSTWHLKVRIPADLHAAYEKSKSKFVEKSLKTTDVIEARKLRDEKLAILKREWGRLRLEAERQRGRVMQWGGEEQSDEADWYAMRGEDTEQAGRLVEYALEEFDRIASRLAGNRIGNRAQDEARAAAEKTEEGRRLLRKVDILSGKLTPLEPLAKEWVTTKRGRAKKTVSHYEKGLRVLIDHFPYKEDITRRKAKAFLDELLTKKAKETVAQYTIAYRGVWKHFGWEDEVSQWSVAGMDSSIKAVRVRPFTDEQYVTLLEAMRTKGNRRLWLASRIAAYTGATVKGVCGLVAEDLDTEMPSLFIPETKKETRTRRIPCHPAILEDVREWVARPAAQQTITNAFSELKKELRFGKEHRFHSFRHSVANRLENARVSDREIKRLLGHTIGSVTFDTYSSDGLGYPVLADVVGKIIWPEVRWDRTT